MRSSKQRSRGNKNRNSRPTGGNIINRVFDSSGPDGKVRGTPQQIIEKYNQLHRDAQLSNDRIAAENFAQHAEHYTRMLAEAMREVEKAREEQDQFNRDRQSERDRERQARLRVQEEGGADPGLSDQPEFGGYAAAFEGDQPEGYPGLVETPEGEPPVRAAFEPRRRDGRDRAEQGDRGPRPERQDRHDRNDRRDRRPDQRPDQRPERAAEARPDSRPDRRDDRREEAPRAAEEQVLPAFLTTTTFEAAAPAAEEAPRPRRRTKKPAAEGDAGPDRTEAAE
jgi:hypothetical protein